MQNFDAALTVGSDEDGGLRAPADGTDKLGAFDTTLSLRKTGAEAMLDDGLWEVVKVGKDRVVFTAARDVIAFNGKPNKVLFVGVAASEKKGKG